MTTLICGSLAFDTIMNFEGRFQEQILPDQLHILNVSFLVPTLRRDFGGCAGNIAYALKVLGGHPLPMATLGNDGQDYLQRLQDLEIPTQFVRQIGDTYTAQAMIMTDSDNNQITAFHPGAMTSAHLNQIEAHPDVKLGIISPDGRDAMLEHAQQFTRVASRDYRDCAGRPPRRLQRAPIGLHTGGRARLLGVPFGQCLPGGHAQQAGNLNA
jgi:adenosine kinase